MTSAQVVSRVSAALGRVKAGHAGTLDPLAEGVLPIAVGEATKTVPFIVDQTKTYEFSVTWGEQRTTDDFEGEVVKKSNVRPTKDEILEILPNFYGTIEQIPPAYSAIKIGGKPAYKRARAGETVKIPPRKVEIHEIKLLECDSLDCASFSVTCGKGTYVRSLARDIAQLLGTVGYVSRLRRTRVGVFEEKYAIPLEKVEEVGHNLEGCLLPITAVLVDIPALEVTDEEGVRLKRGQAIERTREASDGLDSGLILCRSKGDEPIALARADGQQVLPSRVFNI